LGIATGSGPDFARETGEIILIKDERDIVTSVNLGRKTESKIKQSLFRPFA